MDFLGSSWFDLALIGSHSGQFLITEGSLLRNLDVMYLVGNGVVGGDPSAKLDNTRGNVVIAPQFYQPATGSGLGDIKFENFKYRLTGGRVTVLRGAGLELGRGGMHDSSSLDAHFELLGGRVSVVSDQFQHRYYSVELGIGFVLAGHGW